MISKNACAFLLLMFVNQLDTRESAHYHPGTVEALGQKPEGSNQQLKWCGESWALYKDKCYRAFPGRFDRDQAGFICENMDGAQLALPTDLDNTAFINAHWIAHAWNNSPFWISPRQIGNQWTTGRLPMNALKKLPFTYWSKGELMWLPKITLPGTNCVRCRCVVANYLNKEGKWSAAYCAESKTNGYRVGVLCEKKASRRPWKEKHCDEGWWLYRNRCYYSPTDLVSYNEAQHICSKTYNAVLAHPYDFLSSVAINAAFYTTHDWGDHWISEVDKSNSTLNAFTAFASDPGSNTGCVYLNSDTYWYYGECNTKFGFICEKDASVR